MIRLIGKDRTGLPSICNCEWKIVSEMGHWQTVMTEDVNSVSFYAWRWWITILPQEIPRTSHGKKRSSNIWMTLLSFAMNEKQKPNIYTDIFRADVVNPDMNIYKTFWMQKVWPWSVSIKTVQSLVKLSICYLKMSRLLAVSLTQ